MLQQNLCIADETYARLLIIASALHAGDSQTLDSYFKAQSIGAHRPPHIPALRMLPNVASAEAAGLLGTAGQAGRAALGLKAGVGQDLRSQLRASFKWVHLYAYERTNSADYGHIKLHLRNLLCLALVDIHLKAAAHAMTRGSSQV